MSNEFDSIIEEVRKLLEEGKSLAITTIDTPWGSGEPGELVDETAEYSIFRSESGEGRCVQWVVLPSGEIKCARYAD